MANDAKFGLVAGMVAVLAVAVAFYHKPATPGPGTPPPATNSTAPKPLAAPLNTTQPAQAIPK